MTLTDNSMEWLDKNRYRSYPMERDEWRESFSPQSGLDCVLLDAAVFNADARGDEELEVASVSVGASTVVSMSYGERSFDLTITGGSTSGSSSFARRLISVGGDGMRQVVMSFVFSSHAYIKDRIGTGSWNIGKKVMRSRIFSLTDGYGVDGISTKGSKGVEGRSGASVASGDVVLEDGYRTSPIISDGRVLVRVGKRYGIDPCKHDFGEDGSVDCRSPLFYFCGQNAINSGNVVLKGGSGISVTQGRKYKVRSGTCAGKSIPCVEIVATQELLDICRP